MWRWLARNLRTFLLAVILAIAVWVMAVTASDPDETAVFTNPVPIEFIGQDPGLILTSKNMPEEVQVTLRAPHSIWQSIMAGDVSIHAVADLTSLAAGLHTIPLQVQVDASPIRIVSYTPHNLTITLENQVSRTLPIELELSGSPAIGYETAAPQITPTVATITGAESIVMQVDRVQVSVALTDAREAISAILPLVMLDEGGNILSGVSLLPETAQVDLPITQQGGYRDLAVKVMTAGNPAGGYILTSITSLPPIVTVYSADAQLIDSLPGYVETSPLDLNGIEANIEKRLTISLPSGVTLIGEQTVLVQVGIAPIESSRTISFRPVELVGLGSGLTAQVSPQTVDIIISGPLPVLDALPISDVKVILDLTNLAAGTYRLTPSVSIPQSDIRVESILPESIEVIITSTATTTQTP